MEKDVISINIPGTDSTLNIVDPKDKLILIKVSRCDDINHVKQIVELLNKTIEGYDNCNVLVMMKDIDVDILDRADATKYLDENISMLQDIKDLYNYRRPAR